MLPERTRLISVDDHLIEPPHLWVSRLPKRFLDAGPHIVQTEAGADAWMYEGRILETHTLAAVAGRDTKDFSVEAISYSEMRPGCYDSKARLADMDQDGVHASVCFPSFARFAGHRFLEGADRELSLLCVQAYNDFMFDEWCAAAPDRYIPMVVLPLWDIDLAVAEIERSASRGARAIAFSENPSKLGLPSIHTGHWDPVFAAAEAAELVLCMHIGSSSEVVRSSPDAPYPVHVGLVGCNSMIAVVDLLFSPVFHKFPNLKVALSEGGAGWVPYILERADYVWERHRYYSGIDRDVPPSELFARNVWVCLITDQLAIELRDRIGVDRIMWECDYPHSDSLWPHSRKHLAESLAGVPDEEALAIGETNARTLFRFWD